MFITAERDISRCATCTIDNTARRKTSPALGNNSYIAQLPLVQISNRVAAVQVPCVVFPRSSKNQNRVRRA